MIVVKPKGGLCNRLRVINSGVGLSMQINRPLKVLWSLSPDLNCSYFSLFETPNEFEVIDVKSSKPPVSRILRKVCFWRDVGLLRLKYRHVILQSRVNQLLKQKYDFNRLRSLKSVYISCCSRFYPMQQRFQFLRAAPHIQQVVDSYTEQYDSCTIGVHIRRADHRIARQFSSDADFIDAMNCEIQQHPNVKFFVASDSSEVMSRFINHFQGRVISHPKDFSRNTPKGVQDALIDLLCLSKTSKIIGSHYSSFSETAAQIRGVPLHTVKRDGK